AFRYASVLRTIEKLAEIGLVGVHIVSGGGHNRYLNQMTANASGIKVKAGLTEATVVGNALVQAISADRFASLAEARAYVRENFEFEEFDPGPSAMIDAAKLRYAAIEACFVS
ncbi:MAG: FGGY-family carbohydrate kinase, partial [Candidatus Binatia bacterium]